MGADINAENFPQGKLPLLRITPQGDGWGCPKAVSKMLSRLLPRTGIGMVCGYYRSSRRHLTITGLGT